MTANYLELLREIRQARLVEGFGTKAESSLMLLFISLLLKEANDNNNADITDQSLLALFKKHEFNITTSELGIIQSALNSMHCTTVELSLELLEKLEIGFRSYFQTSNNSNFKKFNLILAFSLLLVGLITTGIYKLLHPATAKVTYFSNQNLEGPPFGIFYEPLPNTDFGMNGPKKGMPADNFSIRYESDVILKEDSLVNLSVTSDDGVRVFMDNELLLDYWIPQDSIQRRKAVKLTKGTHRLKIEYFEGLVGAKLFFKISSDNPNHLSLKAAD